MKRYDHTDGGMDEDETGEYVEYEDHVLALMKQDAELATLRAENAHLKRALALADTLRNKERGLPVDVLSIQAEARITDWEGSRGIVTKADPNLPPGVIEVRSGDNVVRAVNIGMDKSK